jgi:hypothetical protein
MERRESFPPFSIQIYGGIDARLGPDLPRGRGKLIGGDLNIDDKGSEKPLILLHEDVVVSMKVMSSSRIPSKKS